MCSAHIKIAFLGCCAAVLLLSGLPGAYASEQNTANTQTAYQAPVALVTRLQVSGSGNRLSLEAERADVQSTLKAVLEQAGKQFAPDATVTGQVTLLLTDQPLETVLNAICEGCYLKYSALPAGIYKVSRDDEAIKKAFGELRQLNAQLRAQLRALGLDVPAEEQLAAAPQRAAEFGGFGAARSQAPLDAAKPAAPAGRSLQTAPAGSVRTEPQVSELAGQRRGQQGK